MFYFMFEKSIEFIEIFFIAICMYSSTHFYIVKRSEQLFQQLNERYNKLSNKIIIK